MNPLPWLAAVKAGAIVALLLVAALWVHALGKRAGLADGETERLRLSARAANADVADAACAASLSEVTATTARDQAAAAARIAAGERAAADAARAAAAAEGERAAAAAALFEANRDPTCREQLEMTLCEAIPLL